MTRSPSVLAVSVLFLVFATGLVAQGGISTAFIYTETPVVSSTIVNVEVVTATLDPTTVTLTPGHQTDGPSSTHFLPGGGTLQATVLLAVEGPTTISFTAVDASGNTGSGSMVVTRDTIPPSVTVLSPANRAMVGDSFEVVLSIIDATTTQLEIISPMASSGFPSSPAPDGHASGLLSPAGLIGSLPFTVRATDEAGNHSEVTRLVLYGLTPPSVSIAAEKQVAGASGVSVVLTVIGIGMTTITLTSDDVVIFGTNTGDFDTVIVYDMTVLLPVEGPNTIVVTAVDPLGGTGGTTVEVIRDTIAPAIAIDSPLEGAVLATGTATVTVTVTDATATTVTVGSNSFPVPAGGGPASGTVSLVEGSNTITVTATDAAGNVTTTVRHVVHTPAPVVTIDSPANGATFGPGESIMNVMATVTDTSGTTLTWVLSELSGGSLPAGGGTVTGTVTLSEGSNTIGVTATDATGRVGQAFAVVTLDTTVPQVTIGSPADGANLRGVIDLHANAVDVLPGSGVARVDLLVDSNPHESLVAAPYEIAFDTKALADGLHVFTAVAIDGKGNASSVSVTARVDNTPPSISIAAPVDGAVYSGILDFRANASDGGSGLTLVLMHQNNPAITQGVFPFNPPAANASCLCTVEGYEGSLLLTATATDAAGNEATASVTIVMDYTAPQGALITPTDGSVVSGDVLIQASGNDPNLASLWLYLNGVLALTTTSSSLALTFPTTFMLDGPLEIKVFAVDLGGNFSTSVAMVTIENLAVTIDPQTLNLKSKGGAHPVSARITGVNVASLTPTSAKAIELRLPGASPVPSTTGWSGDNEVTSGGDVPELVVRFDRQALISAIRVGLALGSIAPGGPVTVTLVAGGRVIGTDSIRIVGE